MPKLGNLKYRDIAQLLSTAGFVVVRQEGSHVAFRNRAGLIAIVPRHGSKGIPLGTVLSILRQARIEKDFAVRFFRGQTK